MKELEKEYKKKNGFPQKQIAKSEHAYIYQMDVAGVFYYNVFYRKENRNFGIVSFPGAECFGKWAWCFLYWEKALLKFNEINDCRNAR